MVKFSMPIISNIFYQPYFIAILAIVIVGGGAFTVWYLWRGWQNAHKYAKTIARISPALLELDEFYTLLSLSANRRSHFYERHGPMLTSSDILERAITGNIEFSRHSGKPITSSRWYRHADLLQTISAALSHWDAGLQPKGGAFAFCFEHEIGEGYSKGSNRLVKTCTAVVIIRKGIVITAYPLLDESRLELTPGKIVN